LEITDAMLALWAKTAQSSKNPDAWHPLICHMIDVAAVARAMWQEVLTPALRARITDGLGLPDEDVAGVWVAYLAGLHDIGKASPAFQAKYPEASERLTAAGLTPGHPENDPGHGVISTIAIGPLLEESGVPRRVANALATAIGGHHGVFPTSRRLQDPMKPQWLGNANWDAARLALATTLAEILDVPDIAPTRTDHPTSMVLAGLISVADWIGSDSERFFRFATPGDIADEAGLRAYLEHAEATADRALEELGWLGWTAPVDAAPFDSLFGFAPRPVQQRVAELPGVADGPGIVVVELPMGEGKTEAAFYLADRWAQGPAQRGLYVAMPTMATSNGMFGRLVGYLEQRFAGQHVNVQLIHSHAAVAPELEVFQDGPPPVDPKNIAAGGGDEPATVAVEEWFSKRKRGLLAPYGVGTVDQSLLMALQTPHVFVRTFGLAGKTVIFDEVHAYDTYMSTLFERLLEWLGAIGTSVVVLTATLPRERRDALLRHYARGAGFSGTSDELTASYPRLSWATAEGTGAEHVDQHQLSDLSRRELRLEWVDMRLPTEGEPFALGKQIRDALRDGGCAAVICNTVARAQNMYNLLKQHVDPDELDLLHARFPFEDRDGREKDALIHFGKPGGSVSTEGGEKQVARPKRRVLVATQVIEQSLDLDFDLMVTDLAPADLVLQRAGRLQRHVRNRPERFQDGAVLWVGEPEKIDSEVPTFDGGSAAIYDEHVLLRSWLALKDRAVVHFPTDIETIIEEVYDNRECPSADPALAERWEKTAEKQEMERANEKVQAMQKWTPRPDTGKALWQMTQDPTREDAPEAHKELQALTRLAQPSVSVVLLWDQPGGASFDRAGERPARVSSRPTLAEAKLLLRRAVSISHPGVFAELIRTNPPAAWRNSSLLRRHRLLLLDADNRASTERYTIELDPELGLRISRKEDA